MPSRVLNEDWKDYDNRKIRDGRDARFFSCEEAWEVDYLLNKIRKYKPEVSEQIIRNAISSCCRTINAPRPRKAFVECVMGKL